MPGSTVQVSGFQFGPSTNAFVSLAGASTGTTITNGSFATTLTVPNVSQGNYTVLATTPQREQASANFYIQPMQSRYPNARPSSWYLLPGQQISFSGSGYAPNAQVTVQGGGGTITATADNNGNFSTDPVTVPYKWQNSTQNFVVKSGGAYDIPITLSVGTFYPNLNPSTYYAGYGQSMSATATGFAPNEQVMLLVNGALVAQVASNAQGAVAFTFIAPSSGSTFTLTAQGFYSGVMSSRTITLH
jgi:hypothetical protein